VPATASALPGRSVCIGDEALGTTNRADRHSAATQAQGAAAGGTGGGRFVGREAGTTDGGGSTGAISDSERHAAAPGVGGGDSDLDAERAYLRSWLADPSRSTSDSVAYHKDLIRRAYGSFPALEAAMDLCAPRAFSRDAAFPKSYARFAPLLRLLAPPYRLRFSAPSIMIPASIASAVLPFVQPTPANATSAWYQRARERAWAALTAEPRAPFNASAWLACRCTSPDGGDAMAAWARGKGAAARLLQRRQATMTPVEARLVLTAADFPHAAFALLQWEAAGAAYEDVPVASVAAASPSISEDAPAAVGASSLKAAASAADLDAQAAAIEAVGAVAEGGGPRGTTDASCRRRQRHRVSPGGGSGSVGDDGGGIGCVGVGGGGVGGASASAGGVPMPPRPTDVGSDELRGLRARLRQLRAVPPSQPVAASAAAAELRAAATGSVAQATAALEADAAAELQAVCARKTALLQRLESACEAINAQLQAVGDTAPAAAPTATATAAATARLRRTADELLPALRHGADEAAAEAAEAAAAAADGVAAVAVQARAYASEARLRADAALAALDTHLATLDADAAALRRALALAVGGDFAAAEDASRCYTAAADRARVVAASEAVAEAATLRAALRRRAQRAAVTAASSPAADLH
jgi:trimeric autotransporter adhesin